MKSGLTLSRLNEIARRQFPVRYGDKYEPSIRATKKEAPAVSRPSIRYSAFLKRDMHALSTPELKAILLAVRHPGLIDLHENAAYNHGPGLHPFAGHPIASSLDLPSTIGTLGHAHALGLLAFHPKVPVRELRADTQSGEESDVDSEPVTQWHPGFYVGDLRLFMVDERGPYVLDWDVKSKVGEHNKPGPSDLPQAARSRSQQRVSARARVLQAYNAELGVRQVQVAGAEIDNVVFGNLCQLIGWSDREHGRLKNEVLELEDELRRSMITKVSPLALLPRWRERGWTCEAFQVALYQALWDRRIRVDLFKPINFDRPLRPEERCVFVEHAAWFSR